MVEKNYKIKFTPKAANDLDDIYRYIKIELVNEDAAQYLMEKMNMSIMRLREFPLSCSFVDDDYLKDKGYRKLIIENYIAFYIVDEITKQVILMRVLYGRQKYEDII